MYEPEHGIGISECFTCRKCRFLGMEEWLHLSFSVIVKVSFPAADLLLRRSESGVSFVAPVQSRSGFAIM